MKKNRPKGHVFVDLDGTLIDTEGMYMRFWIEASDFCGYRLSKEEELGLRSLERLSSIEYLLKRD